MTISEESKPQGAETISHRIGQAVPPGLSWWQRFWWRAASDYESCVARFEEALAGKAWDFRGLLRDLERIPYWQGDVLRAQCLCLVHQLEDARRLLESIERQPLARHYAALLAGARGVLDNKERRAQGRMQRALRRAKQQQWVPARKNARKALRRAWWRRDALLLWQILDRLDQSSELRRLCHKTRIINQAITRRKYHAHGQRLFIEAWNVLGSELAAQVLDDTARTMLRDSMLEEAELWIRAQLNEMNRYRPEELGYVEARDGYNRLVKLVSESG